ncbi:lantibiotic dehydratase [Stackebrandtia nassauensis]|nr:lantibiotic dehydratase [Stackebrandtia nassauensis]
MTSHSTRRGTAFTTPFRVADPRSGLARLPLLHNDPSPNTSIDPVVAEGMFLCSEIHADVSPDSAEQRRATERAFDIRARRRTTPQGVFAGVTELDINVAASTLSVRTEHKVRSYPNPVWVHEIGDRVLDSAAVLHALTYTTNNLAARRGDRLDVQRPSSDPRTGPQRMSVRRTEAVEVVLDVARSGASWKQITTALTQRWPSIQDTTVEVVMRQLTRSGFLLTDLDPVDTCTDPLGHLLAKLPASEPVREPLSWLRAALAEADAHPPGHPARMAALKTARNIADDLFATWRPICTDTAMNAHISIPARVAEEAAQAANVLWRMPPRHDPLAEWHERFLHRYGTGRLVPLLEVCDPVTGLGCDPGNTEVVPPPESTEALARLINVALTSNKMEVQLDAATITALDQRRPSDACEPSAELYATVVARDEHDRDAGKFVLAVTNMASPAGSTRARFAGLLPDASVASDPGHGTMTAELAFRPTSHTVAALTGRADNAPWRIPIGTIPQSGDLALDDLAVVSDGARLRLWSTQNNRPVRPVHHNQVGHHLMPPVAAFLCLLGQHGNTGLSPWTWGPFERAPFTPRVRFRDVILSPARWRLPEEVRDAATDRSTWATALRRWRTSARPAPPATVVIDTSDRKLPLDLDRGDDRELLRRYVNRDVTAVTEPPGGPDAVQAVALGERGHHVLEIVVPVSASHTEETAPPAPALARQSRHSVFTPGSEWLSLAIDAPPSTQDAVLARLADAAHHATGLWHRWFWIRYHTPARGPHLRVRFRGDPRPLGGQLLPLLGDTCANLTTDGLSGGFGIEEYRQEIERYGGEHAIEYVEDTFHHDANLVAHLLAESSDPDERLALTAASAAEIVRIVADGNRAALVPHRLERADRRTHARVRPRARSIDDGTPAHRPLWYERTAALTAYRAVLPPDRRIDCASSLIHMHANRLLGDNHRERIARALAVDLIAREAP